MKTADRQDLDEYLELWQDLWEWLHDEIDELTSQIAENAEGTIFHILFQQRENYIAVMRRMMQLRRGAT